MWLAAIVLAIVVLALIIAVACFYGARRWQSDTRNRHAHMEAARAPVSPKTYESRQLHGLPAPVQRLFRAVLTEGQRRVAAASVEHVGTFNMSDSGAQWKPFTSNQRVIVQPPGFVWDARIRLAPAMNAHVVDAYVAGEGALTAKLFGLIAVMEQPNTSELAQGELMRFLAEGAWYPTALLPSEDLIWQAIDDTQASATLTDGTTAVTLAFRLHDRGLIGSVHSDGRYRDEDGVPVATPWQGRFWDYEQRDGMLIPLEAEVAWLLPEGPLPYWRGRIRRMEYEFAH